MKRSAKPKKAKAIIKENNYSDYLELCESTGLPYTLHRSNYRVIIESSFCNIDFMQNIMSNKAFIVGAMIKKDINATGLVPPDIDKADLKYYDFAPPKYLQDSEQTIYNIDIKSAYASVLYRHGLITKKTAKMMRSLPKKDRLASVGMLASKRHTFNMVGSKVISAHTEEKDTAPWFLFCVQKTAELMDKCRAILGRDFLFYWVDGLFFRHERNAEKVIELIEREGYFCSFDVCHKFKYTNGEVEKVLTYWKTDEDGAEYKRLSLPNQNNEVDKFILKFISEIQK